VRSRVATRRQQPGNEATTEHAATPVDGFGQHVPVVRVPNARVIGTVRSVPRADGLLTKTDVVA